jgi:hypothetical protein
MKRNMGAILAAGFGVLVLVSGVEAWEGHHRGAGFSNASLQGNYVVSFQGWISGGGGTVTGTSLAPQNGTGLLIADGQGNFTGTETANILYNSGGVPTSPSACGGSSSSPSDTICSYNLTGTYSVNSDGTGTTSATATPVTGSDCRCGSGSPTSGSFVMQSSDDVTMVGTDLDATVIAHAHRQDNAI